MPAAGFAYAFVQSQRSAISSAGALRAIAPQSPIINAIAQRARGFGDISLTIEKVRYEESERTLQDKCDRTCLQKGDLKSSRE
jgi:hypothetical protein